MNQFPLVSVLTVVLAFITTIALILWAILDKKSHPYSWLAAIWTAAVFIVFVCLWAMSIGGFKDYGIMFMANAVPGVFLWSLVVMFVIAVNEIHLHLKGIGHAKCS